MYRFVLLALVASTPSLADDPFACVDPYVAKAFLGGLYPSPPTTYSTSVPDNFPELNVPILLTLVGSQVAFPHFPVEARHISVVYKTELSTDAAFSSAVSAMSEAGWTEKADPRMPAMGGSQSSGGKKLTFLCSDDRSDALTLFANSKSGQTFVSYSMNRNQMCNEPSYTARMTSIRSLQDHMPKLKLPEGAKSSNGGGHGSDDDYSTRFDVLTAMSRAELLSFFGDQIQNQQWVFDSGWSGAIASGSVWTLNTPDAGMLIGTLNILGPAGGAVRVRLSVSLAELEVGDQPGVGMVIISGSGGG